LKVLRFWRRKSFKTFQELTVLVQLGEKDFRYFFIAHEKQQNAFSLLGEKSLKKAPLNAKNKFKLGNPQRKVKPAKVSEEIELINRDYKETQDLAIVKILRRTFEKNSERVAVIYRYEDFTVQFVLRRRGDELRIVESEKFQVGLPKISEKEKEEIKEKQILETEVEEKINKNEEEEEEEAEEIRKELEIEQPEEVPEVDPEEVKEQVLKQEYQKILNVITESQPEFADCQVLQVWKKKFQNFQEETCLVKKNNKYHKCYVSINKDDKMEFIGEESCSEPTYDDDGKIEKPEDLESDEVAETDRQTYIDFLNQEQEETVGQRIKRVVIRKFPKATRVKIVVRLETSRVLYIIREKNGQLEFLERRVLKEGLKSLTQIREKEEKKKETKDVIKEVVKDLIVEEKEETQQTEDDSTQEEEQEEKNNQDKNNNKKPRFNKYRTRVLEFLRTAQKEYSLEEESIKQIRVFKN